MKEGAAPRSERHHVLRQFANRTALHGAAYAAESEKWIQRTFWVTVIVLGFLGALCLVAKSYNLWEEKVTLTTVDTFFHSIKKIDAPTLTLCPAQFRPDKWAFLRTFLGQFEFECQGEEKCSRTEEIRTAFKGFLDEYKGLAAGEIDRAINEDRITFTADYPCKLTSLTTAKTKNNNESVTLEEEVKNCSRVLNAAVKFVKSYLKDNNRTLTELDEILNEYLVGKMPQDLDTLFSTVKSMSQLGDESDLDLAFENVADDDDDEVLRAAKKSALIRTIGHPGDLGSLISNFAYWTLGNTFDHEAKIVPTWFKYYKDLQLTEAEIAMYGIFSNFTHSTFNGEKVNVSIFDLPAIFSERYTVYWQGKSWRESFPFSSRSYQHVVKDMKQENRFGKMLSNLNPGAKRSIIDIMLLSTLSEWPSAEFTHNHFMQQRFKELFDKKFPLKSPDNPKRRRITKKLTFRPGESSTKRSPLDILWRMQLHKKAEMGAGGMVGVCPPW